MQRDERLLGRPGEVQVVLRDVVLRLVARELAGAEHRLATNGHRRRHRDEAVRRERVEREADERELEEDELA